MAEGTCSSPSPSKDGNEVIDLLNQSDSMWISVSEDSDEDNDLLNQSDSMWISVSEDSYDSDTLLDIRTPQVRPSVKVNNDGDVDLDLDFVSKFDQFCILKVLENLAKNKTSHSTLEILLTFHYCLNNPCYECRCNVKDTLLPVYNITEIITLMKDILKFLATKTSEKVVRNLDSDCKRDYELHLSSLLKFTALEQLYNFPRIHHRVRNATKQFNSFLNKIISRRIEHYLKNSIQCFKDARGSPSGLLSIPTLLFDYYKEGARIGRFPHILWQETPLRKKIRNSDSLETIFARGKEGKCIVCYMGGEVFKDDFAIFLNCNHLACASCAEQILVDDTKHR